MAFEILAAIRVENHNVVSQSPGVNFNQATGSVTFPNPKNLTVVPSVSFISPNATYATSTVYFKSIQNVDVIVWEGAQDTSGRNGSPGWFSLIVVGF
ncbi:hypothetical protein ACFFWD_10430 [Bradyrhizobium erythrophlei]|uniref:hypothetical protein n=1 Tax=Bradyrhizobium erythrophlei TaxID=1437360 RepID=UPI0035E7680B